MIIMFIRINKVCLLSITVFVLNFISSWMYACTFVVFFYPIDICIRIYILYYIYYNYWNVIIRTETSFLIDWLKKNITDKNH